VIILKKIRRGESRRFQRLDLIRNFDVEAFSGRICDSANLSRGRDNCCGDSAKDDQG
jgi:hypothetical protein